MANINVSWTALANTVTDVDSLEVYVCDLTNHFTDEADFQARLDNVHGGSSVASQNMTLVEGGLAFTASQITDPYDTTATGPGTYHFGVAAKNAGGYKVGNGDGGAIASIVVN